VIRGGINRFLCERERDGGGSVAERGPMAGNPFHALQDRLSLFFSWYGLFVSRHPRPFIVFPTLLTLLLSTGLARFTVQVSSSRTRNLSLLHIFRMICGSSIRRLIRHPVSSTKSTATSARIPSTALI
jgi:hypothetical protein